MDTAPGQAVKGLREMIMRQPLSPIARVVVGVDGSAGAAAAVHWAAAEACRQDVALRIVSAWGPSDQPGYASDPARIAAAWVHKALARVLT
jgi:nucleotide-binding universal stress UspA family protein